MTCHTCNGKLEKLITDLPFKVISAIVIIKGLPVFQCSSCSEYVLDDSVMARVEVILNSIDKSAEVEIVRYAA